MPWGYWLPRLLRGVDIRTLGSSNPGATNVWRTLGFRIGIAVALLDIAKGAAAALLGPLARGRPRRRPRRRRGDGRPLAPALPRLRARRQDGGDDGRRRARRGPAAGALARPASGSSSSSCSATRRWLRSSAALSLPLWALLFGESWPVVAFTAGAAARDHRPPPREHPPPPRRRGAPDRASPPAPRRGSARSVCGRSGPMPKKTGQAAPSGAEPVAELGVAGRPAPPFASSPRSSPTVPKRSASTSWLWIVSKLTWRARRSRRRPARRRPRARP